MDMGFDNIVGGTFYDGLYGGTINDTIINDNINTLTVESQSYTPDCNETVWIDKIYSVKNNKDILLIFGILIALISARFTNLIGKYLCYIIIGFIISPNCGISIASLFFVASAINGSKTIFLYLLITLIAVIHIFYAKCDKEMNVFISIIELLLILIALYIEYRVAATNKISDNKHKYNNHTHMQSDHTDHLDHLDVNFTTNNENIDVRNFFRSDRH